MELSELVFIGFAKYVVALDKATGTLQWNWRIPKGKAYPAMLAEGDRLFVSALGYTYCLDAYTGRLIWENELSGMGTGVACIATTSGQSSPTRAAADVITRQQAAQNTQHSS